MANIDAVAAEIVSAGLPILFLDTCILLDVIRRATNRFLQGHAEAAFELLRLATLPMPRCSLVVSSWIRDEWDANVRSVVDEADRHLRLLEDQSIQFHDACRAIEIHVGVERTRYAGSGLTEQLRALSESLLDAALRLELRQESQTLAFERVRKKIPPARKNAQIVDCLILEDYLAAGRLIRKAGSKIKLVFCTSNTKDYCELGTALHPTLFPEFDELGLTFKSNLIGAVSWLFH